MHVQREEAEQAESERAEAGGVVPHLLHGVVHSVQPKGGHVVKLPVLAVEATKVCIDVPGETAGRATMAVSETAGG